MIQKLSRVTCDNCGAQTTVPSVNLRTTRPALVAQGWRRAWVTPCVLDKLPDLHSLRNDYADLCNACALAAGVCRGSFP